MARLMTDGKRVQPTNPFVMFGTEDVEGSVPARFEQQVRLHSGRVAVKTAAHVLTYDELNHAANRIAHAILERRGPGPEPVALILEHGAMMVAGLLGVLKAGKFYVPLDPSYPPSRLAYMLEDSEASLVRGESRPASVRGSAGEPQARPDGRRRPWRESLRREPGTGRSRPTRSPTSCTRRARPAGRRAWSRTTGTSSASRGCGRTAATSARKTV